MLNYEMLPEQAREQAQQYIENGVQLGRFMSAVICNNLYEAFAHADDINTARMKDHVMFWHFEAPRQCHGSLAKMDVWIKQGGLKGNQSSA